MKARSEEAHRRLVLLGAIVTCGIATAAPAASAVTFSARETHRGLLIDRADGTTGRLVTNGWFRHPGEPGLVYREGSATVAGGRRGGGGCGIQRRERRRRLPVAALNPASEIVCERRCHADRTNSATTGAARDDIRAGWLRRDAPARGAGHGRPPRGSRVHDEASRHAGASAAAPCDASAETGLGVEGRQRRLPLCRPVQL